MSGVVVWKVDPEQPVRLYEVQIDPPAATLDQVSRKLPGGAYTTFRTYSGNQAHHLQAHLTRLKESSREVLPGLILDLGNIRQAVRRAILAGDAGDKRVRLTIDLEEKPGRLFICLEPLKVPAPGLYQTGVEVLLRRLDRQTPKAKLTAFISVADQVRDVITNGINEVLMIDDRQRILEGLTSNFFAVSSREIWTADQEVLSGITRSIVLEEARQAGIALHLEPVTVACLPSLEEAFITSSSRGVLPVTRIEGEAVGSGVPGPLTRELMKRYDRRIQSEIEPI